jgi:hypothetical protein
VQSRGFIAALLCTKERCSEPLNDAIVISLSASHHFLLITLRNEG